MKQKANRLIAMLLCLAMLVCAMPFSALAAAKYDETAADDYYKVISQKDWELAPGITESEIVLNNDASDHRQVLHVVEVDMDNPYTKVIPSIKGMTPTAGNYGVQTMDKQAAYAEANGYGNVVAAMNISLSWYDSAYYTQHSELVGEPLGYMILDGVQYTNSQGQTSGAQTCLVINFDEKDGVARPADIPKVVIRSTKDAITGWEEQVIPANFGFLVKDGALVTTTVDHSSTGAPRSMLGVKADGTIVVVMNDGRQAPYSTGLNNYEMGEVMLSLGCVYAINGDGGGSSQFLSQRPGEELAVHCSPSDGALRPTTHGVLIITTAPSNGEFARAHVESESTYYTPNSTVQFTAVGADLAGAAADIPEEATWQLSDSAMGTIDENGLFTSNGTTGVATAQLIYNDKVVGSASINIVIPETISFKQNVITLPNGETTTLVINATYGVNTVVTKLSDFAFTLSNENVGTLNGYEFTSTSDTSVTGGTIQAALVHDTSKVATATLSFGKASEVIFDFENGTDDWKTTDWKKSGVINNSGQYYAKYDVHAVNSSNGKVRAGNGAMAMVCDFSYGNSTSWNSFYVNYYGEEIKLENAQRVGCWVYVPNDTLYVEFYLRATVSTGKQVSKNVLYRDHETPLESGWHYVSFDVSAYDYVVFKPGDKIFQVYYGGIQGVAALKDYPELNYKSTYYIDDITVDYSTAVADREAPVFSAPKIIDSVSESITEVNGQTVSSNVNTFEVAVNDFVKDNAVGLDGFTAKAYVDGNAVNCVFANGKITAADVEMADGIHTIKFTIEDNNGNLASVDRKLTIAGGSGTPTATVVAHDATLDKILLGSLYWLDVNVTNVEQTDKVKVTINLNNLSQWELDHITTAKGFEASYSIDATDPMDKIATVTITRVGESEITGAGTIASLPVRTWEYVKEEDPTNGNGVYFDMEARFKELFAFYTIVKAHSIEGTLTLSDGTTVPFGANDIQVDTELYANSASGVPVPEMFEGKTTAHVHTVEALEDKPATCTENGYSGRTFCAVCNSVVEWGTTATATGHNWQFNAEGKLACANNAEELFNGVYTDGKTYVDGAVIADGWNADNTAYYVDGVKLTGSHVIDRVVYTFDDNGVYQADAVFEGFIEVNEGKMYFYSNTKYENSFVFLDNVVYYFVDGIAVDGEYDINGETCVFEDGKYVSCASAEIMMAGWAGEKVNFIIYADGSMILTGEGNMYDFPSRAQRPWNEIKRTVRSIWIGKDITSIGNFALGETGATSITFEEGSKLEIIGQASFLSTYYVDRLDLPETVKEIQNNAFKASKFEEIYIPQGTKVIAETAFCTSDGNGTLPVVLEVAQDSTAHKFALRKGMEFVVRDRLPEVKASGKCGENAAWELYDDGKLIISGSGAMADYAVTGSPWYRENKSVTKVVIGKDITYIGKFAFMQLSNLAEVEFEEGSKLETIGWGAFGYTALKDVAVPATVKALNDYAFYNCASLETVTFAKGSALTSIGRYAFQNDAKLTALINMPEETSVDATAFTGTTYKPVFRVASGTCGENATWAVYSNGTLKISGSGAMDDYATTGAPWYWTHKDITKVVIGKDITYIGKFAFMQRTKLAEVEFEEGSKLETIGWGAFGYTALKNVTVPASVKSLDSYAFYNCASLETVTFAEGSALASIGRYAFQNDAKLTALINMPEETSVDATAFTGTTYKPVFRVASGTCGENATWAVYSDGTLKIGGSGAMADYAVTGAPWYAGYKNITKVVIGKDITYIGKFAFMQRTKLAEVEFEEGSKLETIGWGAFGYTALKDVTVPASVKALDCYAFYNCASLETVTFVKGSALTSIGRYAFQNDAKLTALINMPEETSVDATAFTGTTYKPVFRVASGTCGENATWAVYSNGTLKISGSGAMDDYATTGAPWYWTHKNITKVVIGKDITYIGKFAFMQRTKLAEVEFEAGSKLETIGWGAFGYTALENVTIPASVKSLNNYAFYNCVSLETVTFAEGSALTSIGAYAFHNDAKLIAVNNIPKNVTIGNAAFLNTGYTPE